MKRYLTINIELYDTEGEKVYFTSQAIVHHLQDWIATQRVDKTKVGHVTNYSLSMDQMGEKDR